MIISSTVGMDHEKGYFLVGIFLSLLCITKAADVTKCTTSVSGKEYLGLVNVTPNGKPCIPWNQIPIYTGQDRLFPDCTVNDASNYCRNPYDIMELSKYPNQIRPACYFKQPDGGSDWTFCNIPHCDLPATATTCYSAKQIAPTGDSKLCQCRIKIETHQPVKMYIMQIIFEYKILSTNTCDREVEVTMDMTMTSYKCDGSTYTRSMQLMLLYFVEKLEFQKKDPGDSEYAIKVTAGDSFSIEGCGNKDWQLGANWDVKFFTVPTAATPSKSNCTTTPGTTTTQQATTPTVVKTSSTSEVVVAAALGATLGILLIAIFVVIACLSCRRCRWRWKQKAEFPVDNIGTYSNGHRNFTYGGASLELQDELSNGDSQYEWPQSNGILTTSTFKASAADTRSSVLSNGTVYKTTRPEETTGTNYGYYNPADNDHTGGHPVPDYEEVKLDSILPRLVSDESGKENDSPILYTTVLKGNMKRKDPDSLDNNNTKSVSFSKFSTFKTFQ